MGKTLSIQSEFKFPVSVVGFTPISLVLTCMLRICMYRKGSMEGEKRGGSGISVLGGGGSRSAQREPPASRRFLTTLWITTLVRISLSYGGPKPFRINEV